MPEDRTMVAHLDGSGDLHATIEHMCESAAADLDLYRVVEARDYLERARALCEQLAPGDVSPCLVVLEALSSLAWMTSDPVLASTCYSQCRTLLKLPGDRRSKMISISLLGFIHEQICGSMPETIGADVAEALEVARQEGDEVAAAIARATLDYAELSKRGYVQGVEDSVARAHELAVQHGLASDHLAAMHVLVRCAISDYGGAHVLATVLARNAMGSGRPIRYLWSSLDVRVQIRRGRWAEALEGLERIDQLFENLGSSRAPGAGPLAMLLQAETGALEVAVHGVEHTSGAWSQMPVGAILRLHRAYAGALVTATLDGVGPGREAARALFELARSIGPGERHWMATARLLEAELELQGGSMDQAWSSIEQAIAILDAEEMWPTAARVHGTAARVAERIGDAQLAEAHAARAETFVGRLLEGLRSRPELQRAYGAWSSAPLLRARPM